MFLYSLFLSLNTHKKVDIRIVDGNLLETPEVTFMKYEVEIVEEKIVGLPVV